VGTGKLPDETLRLMVDACDAAPGDFAEVGVYRGDTFWRLAAHAKRTARYAHAFDSFEGLAEPGREDVGHGFPRGSHACDVPTFLAGCPEGLAPWVHVWRGWVPDVFLGGASRLRLALVYVDLDHCQPTRDAITWAWPRLTHGGVLAFDDYFPNRRALASPAIDEFVERERDSLRVLDLANDQLVLRRTGGGDGEW